MDHGKRLLAAVTTLHASRWEFLLARLFGRKIVSEDSGCTVTMHAWRGKLYMTDCQYGTARSYQ